MMNKMIYVWPIIGIVRPTDHLPRWRVSGDSGFMPVGPAMTTLRSVIARLASLVRCAGIAYISVEVVIWHSFYMASPWRLVAPVVAMAWMATAAMCLRRSSPAPLFACIDSAVFVAFALSGQEAIPPAVRDQAFSWLVISMSSQLIVTAWYSPAVLSMPLALASPAAYWAGAERVSSTGVRATTSTAILLIMVAGIHLYGRRQLYGRAAAADAALGRADRAASEQYVILSRIIERREHERLLHDTILNTLTAITRAGAHDANEVVNRCRQDVTLIEATLSEPEDPDASAGQRYGDLVGGVQAVATELRARGLTVHVDFRSIGAPVVPARVAIAISGAAREALANVAAHAGTGEAWVEVSLIESDRKSQVPPRVHVAVRDRGAGFDPARVDRARLGMRRSITERIADCGGQAFIWSAPEQGTVVRMAWPASSEPGQEALADWALARDCLPW